MSDSIPVLPTPEFLAHVEHEISRAEAFFKEGSLEAGLERVRSAVKDLDRLGVFGDVALQQLEFRARMLGISGLAKLDRFDEMLREGAKLMDLLALDQPSSQRAELMTHLAFAYTQCGMSEQALRAAHVALQDGLQLKDRLLTAQALERLAMTYFAIGDGASAERFMFEALAYMDQHSPMYERVRRFSNALHLCCSLHDMYLQSGLDHLAPAVLRKVDGFVAEAEALAPELAGDYMGYMMRANLARWHRRCGRLQLARGAFLAVLAKSESAGWYAVRRPVLLELALMADEQGDGQAALELLTRVFEPGELRVRDVVAMPTYRALERLYRVAEQPDLAKVALQGLAARQERREKSAQAAQEQLPQLSARIAEALAEADRARLDQVISGLREQRRQRKLKPPQDETWSG